MSRCFVTGGNGFIGSHLIESLLADGHEVRALARDPDRLRWLPRDGVEIVRGDLDNRAALTAACRTCDVVYHLAALTQAPDEAQIMRANLTGTRNVAEACLATDSPPRLVFLSSQAAGGPSPDGAPIDETCAPAPISSYGRSKLAAERLLDEFAGRLPMCIVRPPSIYGPRDRGFLFLFRAARRGWMPHPSGSGRLSILHVDDLVRGTRLAAERGSGTYYLTDGQPRALREILQLVGEAVGRPGVRIVNLPGGAVLQVVRTLDAVLRTLRLSSPLDADRAREGVGLDWFCSDARARRELGFESRVTLPRGLTETAAWYRREGWLG